MRIKIVCLIISLLWTSLGTFVHISGYSDYNYFGFDYNSSIYWFLWWITFPFNFISFFLLFTGKLSDIYVILILLQSAKVLLYWWIIYKIWLFVHCKFHRVADAAKPKQQD